MLTSELLELTGELGVATDGEVRVDATLECHEPQFVETRAHGVRERLVDEIGERGTAPQRQRAAEPVRGDGRRRPVGFAHQLLEAVQVERRGSDVDRVAAPAGGDDVAAEYLPQL
jgi:hypothetical protein